MMPTLVVHAIFMSCGERSCRACLSVRALKLKSGTPPKTYGFSVKGVSPAGLKDDFIFSLLKKTAVVVS